MESLSSFAILCQGAVLAQLGCRPMRCRPMNNVSCSLAIALARRLRLGRGAQDLGARDLGARDLGARDLQAKDLEARLRSETLKRDFFDTSQTKVRRACTRPQ